MIQIELVGALEPTATRDERWRRHGADASVCVRSHLKRSSLVRRL